MTAGGGASLQVYVHWPFCVSKCPYCDFNSHVAGRIDQRRWRSALLAELACEAERLPGRTVASVFFGGGTPSLMPPESVAAVLDAVGRHWTVTDALEVTLEANPSTLERDLLPAFRAAGVNRVSIGVQSFDDAVLGFLGRAHSADEARSAIDAAAAAVPRTSFDLIYAWPGQTRAHWAGELAEATARAGEHLSVYQLTIERGTAFHRSGVRAADEDTAADLFEQAEETLEAAGLAAYEISNHAAPGAACRHNTAIWQGSDYAGIGPGAHGRITLAGGVHATHRTPAPDRWLDLVERRGHGTATLEPIDPGARMAELFMIGLRLTAGIDRKRFRALTGREPEDAVDRIALDRLVAGGFLVVDAAGLRATRPGRLCLDAVLRSLLGA